MHTMASDFIVVESAMSDSACACGPNFSSEDFGKCDEIVLQLIP